MAKPTPDQTDDFPELPEPESLLRSGEDGAYDLERAPTAPGCYLMRDTSGQVVYVGKAKNLRTRLRQYVSGTDTRPQVAFLMQRTDSIAFLVTATEKEALLLEDKLIKRHKPRYNIRLKDDKTYVSLRLNIQSPFPRLIVTRKIRKDGARYFGPYASAKAVRETVRLLHHVFPLRRCTDAVMQNRTRPCLYGQMKQCTAPCVGAISEEDYRKLVDQVVMVLEGRSDELDKMLVERIQAHAERLEFEQAAELRDRLYALRETLERQRTVSVAGNDERDVFGVYRHGAWAELQVLCYRGGTMLGGRSWSFREEAAPVEDMLSSFLLQYYATGSNVPREVLIPAALEDQETLAELLTEQRGSRVRVLYPQRGENKRLIELAARNAKSNFDEKRLAERARADVLADIQKRLHLVKTPYRIECFDISTTQGEKSVGSMSVFEGGVPAKTRYRRYAIRGVEGQDDFAMLREVLLRRYKRAIEENDLPDLVVIDGGKGQLGVAVAVFQDLAIEQLPVVGLAKSRTDGDKTSPERLFVPNRKNPIVPPPHSAAIRLLAHLRDEAHRFAVTYHRQRRGKASLRTALLEIPGVGPAKAKTLLTQFGSIAKIKEASVGEIAAVPGFTVPLAQTIAKHLK